MASLANSPSLGLSWHRASVRYQRCSAIQGLRRIG